MLGPTGLTKRCSERLEDRCEDVLRITPFEDANMHVQPGAGGEFVQEPRQDITGEPCDPLGREVDVRDDQRSFRNLDDRRRKRLVARQRRPATTRGAMGAQQIPEANPEGTTSSGNFFARAARRNFEIHPQPGGHCELADQVVEHRQTSRCVRDSDGCELHPHACLRFNHSFEGTATLRHRMTARMLAATLAATIASFATVPAAFAVNVSDSVRLTLAGDVPLLQLADSGRTVAQERSCQAHKGKTRVRVSHSDPIGQLRHKGSVVACEQPPRSEFNVSGLKQAAANAIAAAG